MRCPWIEHRRKGDSRDGSRRSRYLYSEKAPRTIGSVCKVSPLQPPVCFADFSGRIWRYHTQIVDCEMCGRLLADYKRSVGFFTKAVQRIPGVLGDDSMAPEVVDHLRQVCKAARDALMEHIRQDHSQPLTH